MVFIPSVKKSNLVAQWNFEKINGTTIYDNSGNGYDLTTGNSPTVVPSKSGRDTIKLVEANSQYAYRNSTTDLNVGTGSYTINCWIYVADLSDYSAYHTLFNKGGNDKGSGAECICDNDATHGGINYIAGNPNQWIFYGAKVWTAGEWQMLTITWDGTNAKMYRNATDITSSHTTVTNRGWSNTNQNFEIGKNYQGTANDRKYWDGLIRHFGIYNVALTSNEIATLYQQTYIE